MKIIFIIFLFINNCVSSKNEKSFDELIITKVSMNGDIKNIKRFLEEGFNPNDKLNENFMIHYTVWSSNEEAVKFLIEKGADVNKKGNLKTTPLMVASENGYKSLVNLLIEKGADIHAKDSDGQQVLTRAVFSNNKDVIKILIKAGSNINNKDLEGRTALTWACIEGKPKMVKLLINEGVDINLRDLKGRTALENFLNEPQNMRNINKKEFKIEILIFFIVKGLNVRRSNLEIVNKLVNYNNNFKEYSYKYNLSSLKLENIMFLLKNNYLSKLVSEEHLKILRNKILNIKVKIIKKVFQFEEGIVEVENLEEYFEDIKDYIQNISNEISTLKSSQ